MTEGGKSMAKTEKHTYKRYKDLREMLTKTLLDRWIPILYSILMILSIMDVLGQGFLSVYTIGIIIGTALTFILCDFTGRTRLVGKLVYLVVMWIIFRIVTSIAFMSFGEFGIMMAWFFGDNTNPANAPLYTFAAFIGFTFFISSVVFYFTEVIYRRLFLLLISFIPCVLYVKREEEFPYVYMVLLIGLYLLLMLKNSSSQISADQALQMKLTRTGKLFLGGFSAAAVALALIIPKSEETPQKIDFDKVLPDSTISAAVANAASKFTNQSGNADFYSNLGDKVIYTVYSQELTYLRRQVFYDFNGEYWAADGYIDKSVDGWRDYYGSLSYAKLQEAVRTAVGYDASPAEKYGLSLLMTKDVSERGIVTSIIPQNTSAQYFVNPMRTYDMYFAGKNDLINRNINGEMYLDRLEEIYSAYNSRSYSENGAVSWYYLLEDSEVTSDSGAWHDLLADTERILTENGETEHARTAEVFLSDYDYAQGCLESSIAVSDNIAALAEQITADCVTDYEKALEIQNYFIRNGFKYDLNYRPPQGQDTPEYFIFESKTGTCSDFATAFSLMAHAVGLPVRYVEGYVPQAVENGGNYGEMQFFTVMEKNAHAYPEVYISGAGWIGFEPTVPSDPQASVTYNLTAVQYAVLGGSVVLAGAAAVFVIFILPICREKAFRRKAAEAAPSEAVVMLFGRMSKMLKKRLKTDIDVLTPNETAELCGRLLNIDISAFAVMFDKACYGGRQLSEEEKLSAENIYDNVNTAAKEYSKRKR